MSEPAQGMNVGRSKARVLRGVAQAAGFAVGIGLLVWAVRLALDEKNIEQLKRLGDAPWEMVALLGVLSAASLAINGLSFWVLMLPVRRGEHRVPLGDVLAVNAVASLLSALPFKVSVMFRFFVHRRKHGVPLAVVGAWLAAFAAVMLGVVGPVGVCAWLRLGAEEGGRLENTLSSAWRVRVIEWWWAIALVVAYVGMSAGVMVAKWLTRAEHGTGVRGLQRIAHRPGGKLLIELAEGVRMLAHARVVAATSLLRVADIAVQAGRFYVASRLLDSPLGVEEAVLGALVFLMLEGAAPTGSLGVSDAGAAATLGTANMPTVLVVRGVDTAVRLAVAAVSIVWLRPDRLIGGKRAAERRSIEAAG